jgi:hypothetical protein
MLIFYFAFSVYILNAFSSIFSTFCYNILATGQVSVLYCVLVKKISFFIILSDPNFNIPNLIPYSNVAFNRLSLTHTYKSTAYVQKYTANCNMIAHCMIPIVFIVFGSGIGGGACSPLLAAAAIADAVTAAVSSFVELANITCAKMIGTNMKKEL